MAKQSKLFEDELEFPDGLYWLDGQPVRLGHNGKVVFMIGGSIPRLPGHKLTPLHQPGRDREAMDALRQHALSLHCEIFTNGPMWMIPGVMGSYHADPADAILACVPKEGAEHGNQSRS